MPRLPDEDPFENFEITDEWASGAKKREESAAARADRYAKINWANRQAEQQQRDEVRQEVRSSRLRKSWPWLAFAAVCVVVVGLGYLVQR